MRIVVTGGGTGGHVYPALEVAKSARESGHEITYLGSIRGQESRLCKDADFEFYGFPSEPVYSIRSLGGIKALANLYRASMLAKRRLREIRPDVLFSTGGYASAPVVNAAKELGIPYVIHEQNTVPGRTNLLLSKRAYAVATTFKTGGEHFGSTPVRRTGMPIRRELRQSAQGSLFGHKTPNDKALILVMGGSQGAVVLNEAAIATATRMVNSNAHWLIVAGTKNFEGLHESVKKMAISAELDIRAYLNADEMANALFRASVVVCRSGGSVAELAAFRKPSVLVPLPSAMGNHQHYNAVEFENMGAALLLPQKDMSASTLEARIRYWLDEPGNIENAHEALAEWDLPNAVENILDLLEEAAGKK